ncbi:MAG TPA: helix-turn-helix domain-containing protein [Burkholderiaceae bacterium]
MSDARTGHRLSPDVILFAARDLLEAEGKLTMRGLAAKLGVDPMAVYHYFPNKDVLLIALTAYQYAGLDEIAPRFGGLPDWQARVSLLAEAYLERALAAPALVRALAQGAAGVEDIVKRFERLFVLATPELALKPAQRRACIGVLADFIHGYALSGTYAPAEWRAELRIVLLGIGTAAELRQ